MPRVLFLTRGDERWGLGHLHRVSWLAGVSATQAGQGLHPEIHCLESARAREFWDGLDYPYTLYICDEVLPAPDLIDRLVPAPVPGDLVVVDWLDSPTGLVAQLSGKGLRVVLLDDYGSAQARADLVVNSLLAPPEPVEQHRDGTLILSGAQYIQVPPEVTRLRRVANSTARAMQAGLDRPVPPGEAVHAVLVSFGGNPRGEVTSVVLEALQAAGFRGRVIVMPSTGCPVPEYDLDLELRPAGPDFHSILAAVDMAVLGGGLSLYESLCLGTPVLAVAVASGTPGHEDHQSGTVEKLAGLGCCVNLGCESNLDVKAMAGKLHGVITDTGQRRKLSAAGMSLVDGDGTMRTFERIFELVRR